MRQNSTSKLLRAVLIAAVLVIALAGGGALDKSGRADATTCDDAFANWFNANNDYEAARLSYFNGLPTTCQGDCSNASNQTTCISDCQTNRHTALNNADVALLSAAGATCSPESLVMCDQAREMESYCAAAYNYSYYSDPDEAAAVLEQYQACRTASKIDMCQ